MYKLGIDVGGTNTDAVLIDENLQVVAAVKNPTSGDIYMGIMGAVDAVLDESGAVVDVDVRPRLYSPGSEATSPIFSRLSTKSAISAAD